MKCPVCGFENENDSQFCGNCGTPLIPEEPEKKGSKKTPVIIAVVIIVVIIAAALIGYFAYDMISDNDDMIVMEETEEETTEQDTKEESDKDTGEDGTDEEETETAAAEETEPEDGVWTFSYTSAPVSLGTSFELPVAQAMATSVIDQEGHDNSAAMVLDGRDETSWQEGVAGEGIGEGISLYLDREYEVKYLAFKLGNWRSDDYYLQNNRPETLKITMGGQETEVSFSNMKQEQWIAVEGDCDTSEIKFEIVSVYQGTNPSWNDTCIAEISVYGEEAE